MIVTRAQVEAELLVNRALGYRLILVGLDGTTINGTNPTVNGHIRGALRAFWVPVADPITVADADFLSLSTYDFEGVLAITQLRLLKAIRGAWGRAESKNDPHYPPKVLESMLAQLNREIDDLQKTVETQYGENLGTLTAGSVALGFVSTDPAA